MQKKIKKVKAAKKKMRGGGMVKAAKKKMQSGGTVAPSDKTLQKAESSIVKGKPKLTEAQKTEVFNRDIKKARAEFRSRADKILEDFAKRVDKYNNTQTKLSPTDYLEYFFPTSKKKKPATPKKKMRGGGMVKTAKKKMMRGGAVKKKMRGGMAKKKR